MKVFYFITKSTEGGAQTVVYELLRGHKKIGDDVKVMAGDTGWLSDKAVELGFSFEENPYMRKTYNPIKLLKAMRLFRKSAISWETDVVSLHSSFSGIVGRFALRNAIPTVYTTHGWGFNYGRTKLKFFALVAERIASRFTKKIICVSKCDKSIAIRNKIANEKKLVVIYNGVDIPDSLDSTKTNQVRIGFLGRFAWPKRQDIFLKSFTQLKEEVLNTVEAIFIGGGENESNMTKLAGSLDLKAKVRFTGSVSRNQALKELSTCQICVLISESEGLPMVLIESLQLGIPVVANAVGGIPELIDNTVGRILPSNVRVEMLTETLSELIENDQIRNSLSISAKERGKRFSADKMCEETFSLYKNIISFNH